MKTILLTNHYTEAPWEIVKKVLPEGYRLEMLAEATESCLAESIGSADYLLASGRVKISDSILEKAVKLRMIQRTGVGLDTIDLQSLHKRQIPLFVNQGVNARSVAEHTILLILACLRKLCIINQNTKNGIWQKQAQGITTHELYGKTVGIIGMGNIGIITADLLNAFGAKVIYYDAYHRSEEKISKQISYAPLQQVLQQADIISLHCPLNETTYHLICAESLAQIKDGAVIVNTARGNLIDETALLVAIQTGKISFAGLDVHSEEPIQHTDGLLSSERVIATPHIGGVTYDSFYRMMFDAMRNIALFDQGHFDEIAQYRIKIGKDQEI